MFFFNSSGKSADWIAVFLGNPGQRYAHTRHNAGFMAADALAKRLGIKIDRLKHRSLTVNADINGHKTLLMKPQTYMNLSGTAVVEAMRYYKTPPEHLLVISDEMSLPPGKLRVRRSGSAGGHNGLKNIIEHCGDGFPRLRIGVGEKPIPDMDTADHVLAVMQGGELAVIQQAAEQAAECVECIIVNGIDTAMSKYN